MRDRNLSFVSPALKILVPRKVFKHTFHRFANFSAAHLKKRVMIKYKGEEDLDYGGSIRDWFSLLSKELIIRRGKSNVLSPSSVPELGEEPGLFCSRIDSFTFQPSPDCHAKPTYYKFIGRLAGLALATGNVLNVVFTPSMYKHMPGIACTYEDMELLDPQLYKKCIWLLVAKTAAEVKVFGYRFREHHEKRVTIKNRHGYVECEAEHHMNKTFLEGFHEVVLKEMLSISPIRNFRLF